MDVQSVLDRLAGLDGRSEPVLVGIGGHGGAGKSTLAAALEGATVVGTDEFWDGTEFDLRRLRDEVVLPLARQERAVYRSFDWTAQVLRERPRVVEPRGLVVVEGVCALHRMLRDAYRLRVWVEAPAALRLARGVARDGEGMRAVWVQGWMPKEDAYVARDDPVSAADLVVDGSGPPP